MLMNSRGGHPLVDDGGHLLGGCMLMNSRGRPPFGGLYVDDSRGGPPFGGLYVDEF